MKRLRDSLTTVAFGALLVPSWILFGMDPAQSANKDISRQQLAAHLTPEMLAAPLVQPVPTTTKLTLLIGLVIPNSDQLLQGAQQVSDPNSPSYRKYLTPEQVADRFGAPTADYQALLDWANSHHFAVTAHKNKFVATVVGSVADIEAALNVHMLYRRRPDGTTFFAPNVEPSIELGPKVEHISGLENFVPPQRAGGSGAGGTYQGSDFRNAYAPGIALRGEGQSIGIFMSDGFAQSDIDGYATLTHQSFLPVEEVPPNSASPSTSVEGTLDIEMAFSMAPAAKIVVFLGNASAILANMTDRTDIKQFSSSWFWYNGTTMDEQLMAVLAMNGQSFFQASGDGGTYPAGWPNATKYVSPNLNCRQFPYITIVGGTSLNMSNGGASYGALETAWGGSSGGALASVPIPSYQSHIAGHNGASSSERNVPDVSAQAAQTNLIYQGGVTSVGGTSQATPLWAGYMALANELAAAYGSPSVGFANPALYAIANTSAYDADFHDVTSGCAGANSSGQKNCAGSGYDLATGLGSPQHHLIYDLARAAVFPLFCQGPLKTSNSSTTPFEWAQQGAGAATPAPGHCAWADRGPRGTEIISGGNVLAGQLGDVANLPAGEFGEIGVYNNGHEMVVTQIVGKVNKPFPSQPTLP